MKRFDVSSAAATRSPSAHAPRHRRGGPLVLVLATLVSGAAACTDPVELAPDAAPALGHEWTGESGLELASQDEALPVLAGARLAGSSSGAPLPALAVIAAAPNALTYYNIATYNMQGASTKWGTDLPTLVGRNQIVALQEAGPVPALDPNGTFRYQRTLAGNNGNVYEYTRNFGTSTRPNIRYVYFMVTDRSAVAPTATSSSGGRVNLAIVGTAARADGFATMPRRFDGARTSFGIRYGSSYYFTIHAVSPGGNDGPGMVDAINTFASDRDYAYAAMGDFNRDPLQMDAALTTAARAATTLYRAGQATQISGGELDYMLSSFNAATAGGIPYTASRTGFSSDHFAVEFNLLTLRAAAGSTSLVLGNRSNYITTLAEDCSSYCIDRERVMNIDAGNVVVDSTSENATFTASRYNYSSTNKLQFVLRNQSNGLCITIDSNNRLVDATCNGTARQAWSIRAASLDAGQTFVTNVSTGTAATGRSDFADESAITAATPASNDTRQWWTITDPL